MAFDMTLKIGKIKGESVVDKHKDEIDVLSWSWGASQAASMHVGGGGGAGKANFQDISMTKWVDSSTPKLLESVATGEHIDTATLTVRKAGGKNPVDYLKIELKDIIVSSIATGGSGGEDRLTENVSLNFRSYKLTYQAQDEKGAKKGGEVVTQRNIAENKDSF